MSGGLTSRRDFGAQDARRGSRTLAGLRVRRSLAPKEVYASVRPVPRIFKPISPLECVSVFDGTGKSWNDYESKDRYPLLL